jgi:hypothetical protein
MLIHTVALALLLSASADAPNTLTEVEKKKDRKK